MWYNTIISLIYKQKNLDKIVNYIECWNYNPSVGILNPFFVLFLVKLKDNLIYVI